jgi:hypothetical protein
MELSFARHDASGNLQVEHGQLAACQKLGDAGFI